jgi:DeoR family fructose operon transcriptional repressor
MQAERLTMIRQHLYAHGPATVQTLAEAVAASLATVRRDLRMLEREGVIERVHGGARIADGGVVEAAFAARENRRLEAKRTIAAAAFALLRPHSAVFLDAGTTVLQLARSLSLSPLPLTVFTNGLAVAQELLGVKPVRLVMLGGQIRGENASVVGPQAEAMLDRLSFDQLYLGVSAIGVDGMIHSFDPAEASVNSRMLARAAQCYVLADASKFGLRATYAVAPLRATTAVISDAALSAEWRARLSEGGVELTIAGEGGRDGRR